MSRTTEGEKKKSERQRKRVSVFAFEKTSSVDELHTNAVYFNNAAVIRSRGNVYHINTVVTTEFAEIPEAICTN